MIAIDMVNPEPAILALAREAVGLADSLRTTARTVTAERAEGWSGPAARSQTERANELAGGLLHTAGTLDDLADALANHARAASAALAETVEAIQRAANVAESLGRGAAIVVDHVKDEVFDAGKQALTSAPPVIGIGLAAKAMSHD